MITKLKTYANRMFEIHAQGKLTLEDFTVIKTQFDKIIADNKYNSHKIFGYLELDHVPVPAANLLQMDLAMGRKYKRNVGSIAVVGDSEWEKAWCKFMGYFTGVKTKFFSIRNRKKAHKWIEECCEKDEVA